MWRVVKWIAGVLWLGSFGLTVYVMQQWISGKDLPNLPPLVAFFQGNWALFLSAIPAFGVLSLAAFQRDRLNRLLDLNAVRFYKSARKLGALDIINNPHWYDPYFLERLAVSNAIEMLTRGQGVLLVGVPLIGKSRCAFETLKRLRGYHILGLSWEKPKDEIGALKLPRHSLIRKPKLVLFLDDLQNYRGRISPALLCEKLRRQSSVVVVLATCHSGDELAAVKRDKAFGPFVAQYLREVGVEEMSKSEEQTLAGHFKREWNETKYNGTPGAIVLGLDGMRVRLDEMAVEAQTLMRSLHSLSEIGLVLYRLELAESVASRVYEMKGGKPERDRAWATLEENGFLAVCGEVVVPTHEVYLESSFWRKYEIGRASQGDVWGVVSDEAEPLELVQIAILCAFSDDYQLAETGLRTCVKWRPADPGMHASLADILAKQGRMGDAETELREAIRLNPSYVEAHSNLGFVLVKQSRIEEAGAEFREAIRINPNYGEAHFNLALVLGKQGRIEEAEAEHRQVIRINPDFAEAHNFLGMVLRKQDRIEEAEAEFREAIRINPNYDEAHNNMALVLEEQGRIEEAEKEAREAIRINPGYVDAHVNLGVILSGQGRSRIQEEEAEYREAIRINPNDATAHYNLGLALGKQDRIPDEEAEYRQAIYINPDFAEAHYELGVLMGKQCREEEEEAEYREALRINPAHYEANSDLSVLLVLQGRKEEAAQLIKERTQRVIDFADQLLRAFGDNQEASASPGDGPHERETDLSD